MNPTVNVSLFTLAAGSIGEATNQLTSNHILAGAILAVIGIALVYFYEKTPASTTPSA